MNRNSLAKLGGANAILVGISYIVVGIAFFMLPPDQHPSLSRTAAYFESVAQNSTALRIEYMAFGIGSILAVSVVMALAERFRPTNEGLVRWVSTLAVIGFAVMTVQYLLLHDHTSQMAAAFVMVDESAQTAILAMGPRFIAGNALPDFGLVGLWMLVINWLALRSEIFPNGLAYVGLATGVAYAFVVAGNILNIGLLISIAAGLGGVILAPIWFIWVGVRLRNDA